MELREVNTSKIYKTGTKWKSNNYGTFTIVGQCVKPEYSCVEFPDCGLGVYTAYVHNSHIKRGSVSNKLFPSVYGKGYLGVGKHVSSINNKDTREYKAWHGIMERCYSDKWHEKYPKYKGCTVEPRWWNFQTFCEDIKELDGYDEWVNRKSRRELDKDIEVKKNRVYSRYTCIFALKTDNVIESNLTGDTYIATRISDGYTEEFINQSLFAEQNNLSQGNMYSCLVGKRKTHKGWTFCVKEEGECDGEI